MFSEDCFKCDCESVGSTGDYCNVQNGQCPCQRGRHGARDVIGRRCDTCEDKQGEIISGKGCVGECRDLCSSYLTERHMFRQNMRLSLPNVKQNFGKRTFLFTGAEIFNKLPLNIVKSENIQTFCRQARHFFLS